MADAFLASSARTTARTSEARHTVSLTSEAYHALCRLRRDDQQDTEILENALTWFDTYSVVSKALGEHELVKAVDVVKQMRNAGYSDEWAVGLCRALFRKKEKDLRKAFKLFDQDNSGYIESHELRTCLPLMGEEVPEEKIDELFELVDKDGTGLIDFEEFCKLVEGMNPSEDSAQNDAFAAFRNSAEENIDVIGGAVGSMASGTGAAISALSTAWSANLPGLSPFEMRRAGAILNNMLAAGYSEEMATTICRALFCGQTERQLQKAFKFFDADENGMIDVQELQRALQLMAEEVKDEDIHELFDSLDHDGNGTVDFDEFCVLVKAIKEKGDDSETSVMSAVSSTWEKISASLTGSSSHGRS